MADNIIIPVGMEIDSSVATVFNQVAANAAQTSKKVAMSLSNAANVQAAHRKMQASAQQTFHAMTMAATKYAAAATGSATVQVAAQMRVAAGATKQAAAQVQAAQTAAGAQVQAMQFVAGAQKAQISVMTHQMAAYTSRVLAMQNMMQAAAQKTAGAVNSITPPAFGRGGGGAGGGGARGIERLLTGSQFNAAFNRGVSNVSGMGREVLSGMGVSLDVSSSMQRNLDINKEATQLAIQGGARDVPGTAARIEQLARKTAVSTGADPSNIVKGLRQFQAYTGDLEGGIAQLGNMAASSVAYDTPIEDLSSLYAVITKYMGGKDAKPESVDALVRTIATQGREGAVEIRDQIKQDPKILVGASQFAVTQSQLAAFGGDKRAAQAGMGLGLMQSIMGVSGESAQQSGNAVKSFIDALSQKNTQAGMAKHGVDLFTKDPETGKKVFKPLTEIIAETTGAMQKDPTFLREMMGNVRGRKVIQAMVPNAMKAFDEAKTKGLSDSDAQAAAANVALEEMNRVAMKFQTVASRQADVQNFLASEAGQAAQMQARVRETMDEATKGIIKAVFDNMPKIESGMKSLGAVLGWAAEHPGAAAGAAFAAPIAQQVAANAISGAIGPMLVPALAALGPFVLAIGAATLAINGLLAILPKPELGKNQWWESNADDKKGSLIDETTLNLDGTQKGKNAAASPYESNLAGWGDALSGKGGFGVMQGNWVEAPGQGNSLATPEDEKLSMENLTQAVARALRGTPITVGNMPASGGGDTGTSRQPAFNLGFTGF